MITLILLENIALTNDFVILHLFYAGYIFFLKIERVKIGSHVNSTKEFCPATLA